MKIELLSDSIMDVKTELIGIGFTEEDVKALKEKKQCSDFEQNYIHAIHNHDFKGEANTGHFISGHGKAKRIFLIGLGKEKDFDVEKCRRAACGVLMRAKASKITDFVVTAFASKNFVAEKDIVKGIAEGLVLGNYEFNKYKIKEKKEDQPVVIKDVHILLHSKNQISELKKIIADAEIVCANTNMVKDLVNTNAQEHTPEFLADHAKAIAKELGLKCTVFDEKEIKKMGMGLLTAVGQGSQFPPRFVILEYHGNPSSKEKIAVIGKGITFDSGGLNLKPTGYIETMKLDMSGAAITMGVIKSLAELKANVNVMAVFPTCENIIGPKSYHPGDVFIAYNGKSVEIGNTDAEGRLVLGDALSYTEKNLKPTLMIDLATLTGACVVGLGENIAGAFSNKEAEEHIPKLEETGKKVWERVWRMPLNDEFVEAMKGTISDLKNDGKSRYGGASQGAAFLSQFVSSTPWVHLDIAGPAFLDKGNYYIPKGSTGFGVRLLVDYILNHKHTK